MSAPSTAVTVATAGGLVAGTEHEGAWCFRAIPYAAAPLGALRFQAPRPHEGWAGVLAADAWGAAAPQATTILDHVMGTKDTPQSEDCLSLNVFTPAADDARRPVLVWVHGGAFTTGTAATPWYSGAAFARNGDVVVVSLNYRLGALGYLHLGDHDPRFPTSGINGSLDQLAAIDWVRANIAGFGGDPDNITVFGESAGGAAVLTLAAMPAAAGRFRRVAAQSPSLRQLRTREEARRFTDVFLHQFGGTIDELIAAPVQQVLEAQRRTVAELGPAAIRAFAPTVGLAQLPEDPATAFQRGHLAQLDVLIGTTADEMNLFTAFDPTHPQLDRDQVLRRAAVMLSGDRGTAERVLAGFERSRPEASPPQLASALATEHGFRLPAVRLAASHAQQGGRAFVYLFRWPTPAFGGALGACHGLEIPFVFHNLNAEGVALFTGDDPERERLAGLMHRAWIAFARNGGPVHDELPHWPRYHHHERSTVVFTAQATAEVVDDPDGHELALWDGID